MKTVEELRQIVKDVKARGDDAPSHSELHCNDCPAKAELCDALACTCLQTIEVWCAKQDEAAAQTPQEAAE